MMSIELVDAEMFWRNVDQRGNDCWPWTGMIMRKGYGVYRRRWGKWGTSTFRRLDLRAHRVAYELTVGPIPEGLQIDHLCRNRACVNPTHLEPVTNRENSLRGTGITATNAARSHCSYGHDYTPDTTRIVTRLDGRTYRECRICRRIRKKQYRRGDLETRIRCSCALCASQTHL